MDKYIKSKYTRERYEAIDFELTDFNLNLKNSLVQEYSGCLLYA